ncbi:hypothetical protein KAW65_09160, partial [candidate division WOR-3 bacterium]|nr:hypothetical protein [candidate division WOR-3 bacterium]
MITILILTQIFSVWANSANYITLSGTNTVLARGVDAILYNPANLSLGGGFSLRIITPSVNIFNNSFSLSDYNNYSSGKVLSDADKRKILSSIPDDGFQIIPNINIGALELAIKNFGFSVRGVACGKVTIPKEFFDLALFGNEINKNYSFTGLNEIGIAYMGVTFSYGQKCQIKDYDVSFGSGFRFLRGFFVADASDASFDLVTSILPYERYAIIGDGTVHYRTARGGNGFAFDFGCTACHSDPES